MRHFSFLLALLIVLFAGMSGYYPVQATLVCPSVSAHSAILIEAESGEVLAAKNAEERRPMASTTKIMTALVVLESLPLDRMVTVSPKAVGIEGSSVYLQAGEHLSVRDLLYAVLLQSANDAAAALAIETAGSIEAFAGLMNETAARLGLQDTSFSNPHGLDAADHYTTAADLAALTAYALQNETFAEIVSTYKYTLSLHDGESARVVVNHNRLLRSYEGCIGVKTGFTKTSGRCLVSAAKRDGLTLICVTLSAPDDWADHASLFDYGFSRYTRLTFFEAGEMSLFLPVAAGEQTSVTVTNTDRLSVLLPCDHGEITSSITAKHFYYAPLAQGQVLGTVTYYLDGRMIAQSTLVANHAVAASPLPSLWERILALLGIS